MKVQVDYAPPKKDPSDENRSATDRIFTYIGAFVFIAWVVLACHQLYSSDDTEKTSEDEKNAKDAKKILKDSAILFGPTIIVTGAMILVFHCLIYWIPKVWVRVAMVFSIIGIVLSCIGILMKLLVSSEPNSQPKPGSDVSMIDLFKYLIQSGAILLSLRLVELNNIAEFIKKSLQALFNFPSLIPFSLCMLFLQTFVVFISFIGILQVNPDKISATWVLSKFIIILAGIYVYISLLCFEWMVVSHILASWHYTDSKNDPSSHSILRSISIVSRHHLGSVAFAATIIPPLCLSIYTAITHPSKKRTEPSNLLVKILWYILLIFSLPEYSFTLIAAYGMNTSESMRRTWDIMTRKCMFSFALVHVAGILYFIGLFITISLSIFLMVATHLYIILVPFIIALVIISSIVKLAPAIATTLVFSLENDSESENENGAAYNMKV